MRILIILMFFSLSVKGQLLFMMPVDSFPDQVILGYGKLYNKYAVNEATFAPSGWHVPSAAEWQYLFDYLVSNQAGELKETGFDHWDSPNTGATNSTGFFAFGAGKRYNTPSTFYGKKLFAYFHSTGSPNTVYFRYNDGDYHTGTSSAYEGLSVRLIKDNSTDPITLTDVDGNVYNTVKIDTQVWIVDNWRCIHLNDSTLIPNVINGTDWGNLTSPGWCYYDNDGTNN